MNHIAVAHIVWRPLGAEVFRRFVASYRSHSAGHPHELVLLFKGFDRPADSNEFTALASDIEHRCVFVEDRGYDIGAYLTAVQRVRANYYCFLNSNSEILGEEWLGKLFGAARRDRVGIVGATGSWGSLYTDHLNHCAARRPGASRLRYMISKSSLNRLRHLYQYRAFPNAHVRTNAFMLRRETIAGLSMGRIRTRRDTSRLENGRKGLTRQILDMKMLAVVVGKDGEAYEHGRWPNSNTFWISDQQNLLVADNQTAKYQNAAPADRAALMKQAWGS